MHQAHGARQAWIGEAGHHPGALLAVAQNVPQQLNHQQFEQPVHHRFATTGATKGFVEQPVQRPGQHRHAVEAQHQVIRQRRRQGIARPAVEGQRSAHQLRTRSFMGKQAMAVWAREKNQGRLLKPNLAVIGQSQRQFPRLKQMQVAGGLFAVKRRSPAKMPAVEGAGTDTEMRKQSG
ncbi:hypothetical protein EMIT0P294_140155 [Pseudomonas sp. IT-P294]